MYNRIWRITTMCWLVMGLGAAMGQDVPPDGDLKIKRLDENLHTHPKTDPYDGWRLGIQAYSFNRYTLFEAIDKTASLGLDWIEMYPGQGLGGGLDGALTHTMSAANRKAVKEKLKDAGLTLVNYGVVTVANNEKAWRQVFDFAKDMGIETIVSEPKPEAFDLLERLCQEYNINLAVHNHPKPSFYWNPDTVLEVCRGRIERIGACADTGHWVRSGLDPVECLKRLEGRILCSHFKEIEDGHDVIWGQGQGQAPKLLEELHRQGFQGVFSIEYEYHWKTSVPEIRGCVEFFNQFSAKLNPTGWRDLIEPDMSNCVVKPGSWKYEDGVLTTQEKSQDIFLKDKFGDFILDLEFKLTEGANSGIIIRSGVMGNWFDWLNEGIEVQIYDTYGKRPVRNSCGAIYDCVAPSKEMSRPVGEWNRLTIICKANKIYEIFNREQVIDMDLDEWTEAGKNPDETRNKFNKAYKDMPRVGYIGFQHYGNKVWYRNLKIKPLK